MKKHIKVKKGSEYTISLQGELVTPGPGTVPTSTASVSHTSIEEVIKKSREASKEGLFDDVEDQQYEFFNNPKR